MSPPAITPCATADADQSPFASSDVSTMLPAPVRSRRRSAVTTPA